MRDFYLPTPFKLEPSDRFNSSGCKDPTYYEALKHELIANKKAYARYRPIVYICSPYAGDVKKNVKMARIYSRFAVESFAIPLTLHLLFPQFMDDDHPKERELAMFMNKILLGKCDELWVFGETFSEGMQVEIKAAKKRKMKIRYFDDKFIESILED